MDYRLPTKKKILITGASGTIGSLVRQLYKNHLLELWSTKKLVLNNNENFIKTVDLADKYWWGNAPFRGRYDVIFHLAEPVKCALSANKLEHIVNSHITFLRRATEFSSVVIYPLTAYRYDQSLDVKNRQYRDIKERVVLALRGHDNILFPIIHPIIDYGNGLHVIKNKIKKIPFINLFSEFNAELPVLKLQDLERYLKTVENKRNGIHNVYTGKIKINEIFNDPLKKNSKIISKSLYNLIKNFDKKPEISILVHGRKIND